MAGLTHDDLVERCLHWMMSYPGIKVALPEYSCGRGEIPDVLGFFSDGRSLMVECKASREDFAIDHEKSFRKQPDQGVGDRRYYACPADLLQVEEIPARWGLLWVYPRKIRELKRPTTQPKNAGEELRILTSVARRIHIRGLLPSVLSEKGAKCSIEARARLSLVCCEDDS